MGFWRDVARAIGALVCALFGCEKKPAGLDPSRPAPTFPTTAPVTTPKPGGPNIPTTTSRPDPPDQDPIWKGNKTFADCEVLDGGLFKDWCDVFGAKSNRSGVPRVYTDMMCQNRTDCAYRFSFTQDWNLRYTKSCSDGSLAGMIITLNDTGRSIIKQKCDAYSSGIPLYALILIFLGVLAILITIATFAWNRGKRANEAIKSQMSQMPTDRSAAISNLGTMRSSLPAARTRASGLPSRLQTSQTSQRSSSRSRQSSASQQSSRAGNSARMSSALSGSRSSRNKASSNR